MTTDNGFWSSSIFLVGQDSAVSIATCYGLDGPGIESRLGTRFSAPFQTGPGAHPVYTIGTGSFPGVKRPGLGIDHPPPYSVRVKERVELYLYSTSGRSWPVKGWTVPLPIHFYCPCCYNSNTSFSVSVAQEGSIFLYYNQQDAPAISNYLFL